MSGFYVRSNAPQGTKSRKASYNALQECTDLSLKTLSLKLFGFLVWVKYGGN